MTNDSNQREKRNDKKRRICICSKEQKINGKNHNNIKDIKWYSNHWNASMNSWAQLCCETIIKLILSWTIHLLYEFLYEKIIFINHIHYALMICFIIYWISIWNSITNFLLILLTDFNDFLYAFYLFFC